MKRTMPGLLRCLQVGTAALMALPALAEQPDTFVQSRPAPLKAHRFGSSVAVASAGSITYFSTRIVIGAFGDDTVPGVPNAGRVYYYDSFWGDGTIDNPSPGTDDSFGYAVACTSEHVVVGAPKDDDGASDAGSVHVARITSSDVSLTAILNPTPHVGDSFGSAVAISGRRVVVGASLDDTGAPDAGSVYVYDVSSTVPTRVATLRNPSPAPGDWFGHSVAISGTLIVVGAPHDDAGATNAGSVYLYDLSSPLPSFLVAVFNAPDPTMDDLFGGSVGVSGPNVVVGAPGSGATDTGAAYVYDTLQATPGVTLSNPSPSPGGRFGYSVAVSGTRVLVGGGNSASAYVYELNGAAAVAPPVATLDNPEPAGGGRFGGSVAIDGTNVAIGSPSLDAGVTDAGSTHIFASGWGLAEATDFNGVWTNGSGATARRGFWEGQVTTTLDGVDAVEGRLGGPDVGTTWMRTTVTGPTTLYFSYRVENLVGFPGFGGGFSLGVGGTSTLITAPGSGFGSIPHTGWRETSTAIPDGPQVITWQVSGDSDVRVHIDQVWTSDDARPRITDVSKPALLWAMPFSWKAPIASSTPATLGCENLPPGLEFDANTHVISGTPTIAGSTLAKLSAVNASGKHIAMTMFHVEPATTTIPEGLDFHGVVFTEPPGQNAGLPPGRTTAWSGARGIGHQGTDCARGWGGLGPVGGGNVLSGAFQGPGTLSFWYRCGALDGDTPGAAFPSLRFSVAGFPTLAAALEATEWTEFTTEIPAGPQTVSWASIYASGNLNFADQRYVYVDEVDFVPSTVPPQPTFAAWQSAWNVTGQPTATDVDADGLTLPMEYALGGSPYAADRDLLPVVSVSDGYLTINVIKASSPTDLLYFVQASRDLVPNSWTTSSVEVLDEDGTHILARLKKPVSEQPISYLRVRVLVSP